MNGHFMKDKGVGVKVAVNLHDAANDLEKAIRNSSEYAELQKMFSAVQADEQARQMFGNFRNIQMQLQQKQMMGEDISEQEVQQAQQLITLVQQHELISGLMEAEQRMSVIINDLNQIIMKPLEELYQG